MKEVLPTSYNEGLQNLPSELMSLLQGGISTKKRKICKEQRNVKRKILMVVEGGRLVQRQSSKPYSCMICGKRFENSYLALLHPCIGRDEDEPEEGPKKFKRG